MKRHNKLFEFPDTLFRVFSVGRIATLKAVVVLRVISPVILCLVRLAFVNCRIIFNRQKLNVCNSQLHKVVNSCFFSLAGCSRLGKSQEFSSVFKGNPTAFVNGKIPDVSFINNSVARCFALRIFNLVPAFGICCRKIHNCASFAVYATGFCININSFLLL